MRYWVVKGRPSRYDLDQEVRAGRKDRWVTKAPPRDWSDGDRVFMWSSGNRRHMVALGVLEGVPGRRVSADGSFYYIRYLTDPLSTRIQISDLRRDRTVASANFLKPGVAQGVLQVAEDEARRLYQLMAGASPLEVNCWPDIPLVPPARPSERASHRADQGGKGQGKVEKIAELGELDGERVAKTRREQVLIRELLLHGDDKGVCVLCGRILPARFLVAAHIKPRACCSDSERRDVTNNVALMCVLGCDSLFESGAIVVARGKITNGPRWNRLEAVKVAVNKLVGRDCPAFTSKSEQYFRWRRDHVSEHDT